MRMASFLIASLTLHAAALPLAGVRQYAAVPTLVPVTILSTGDGSEDAAETKPAGLAMKAPQRIHTRAETSLRAPAPAIEPETPFVAPSAPTATAESGIPVTTREMNKEVLVPSDMGIANSSGLGTAFGGTTGNGNGGLGKHLAGSGYSENGHPPNLRSELQPLVKAAYRTTTKPDYPERARREGKEGRVLLHVLVDEEGRSKIVAVDTSSGSDVLDQAAREAIKKWRFSPARQGEKAVESWVKIPIDFRLTEARN